MKKRNISPELKDFVRKIIAVDLGLLLIAGVMALSLKSYFGMILFVLGILSTVIGSSLGGPSRYELKNPKLRDIKLFKRPSPEEIRAQMMHSVKTSVPFYAFENVLLFAGLFAIVVGLLVLFK